MIGAQETEVKKTWQHAVIITFKSSIQIETKNVALPLMLQKSESKVGDREKEVLQI